MSVRTENILDQIHSSSASHYIQALATWALASAVGDIAEQMENFTEVFSRMPVGDLVSAVGDIAGQMENFSENLAWMMNAHADAIKEVGAIIDRSTT